MDQTQNRTGYFDLNSTTPFAPGVLEAMLPYLQEEFGNPSSSNGWGKRARAAVERAREQLARFLGASPGEVVFTSGGTESIFAALVGALRANPEKRHIIISEVEHPAVHEAAEFARELLGAEVTRITVDGEGALTTDAVCAALRPDTAIVSIMYANNETGVIFPIQELASLVRGNGTLMHTDSVQATGKELISFSELGVDLLSLSGHKFGASKGVGALLVRDGAAWSPIVRGGGQERGRRGGTESVALIAGLGAAAEIRQQQIAAGLEERIRELRDRFEVSMKKLPGIVINGERGRRLSNTSSVRISGILAADLIAALSERGIAVSAGAACKATKVEPSHVLRAMGLSLTECMGTIRVSFGPDSGEENVAELVRVLNEEIPRLRREGEEALHRLQAGGR